MQRKTRFSIVMFLMLVFMINISPIYATEDTSNTENNASSSVENNYQKEVTFKNQWVNESRQRQDSTKQFNSANDKLGEPLANPGLFRGAAKLFLGWSDKLQTENGKLAEGARLFSKEDSIGTVFPSGIPDDAEIYPVYLSLNNLDDPLPDSQLALGLALLGGINNFKINDNKLTINTHFDSEDSLPGSKLHHSEKIVDENNKETLSIVELYEEKNFMANKNEIVLESVFEMDKGVAMLVYRNPQVGYVSNVLSSKYAENNADGGDFAVEPARNQRYTYMDLKVSLDEKLSVPEQLFVEFKGYSWRPLYILSGENKLNVINPLTGENLGNHKHSFNSLITKKPETTFSFETAGNKEFTLRMILRSGDERIAENEVVSNGISIGEEIVSNMTLRTLKTDEIIAKYNKTKEQAYNYVISISNDTAKRLATTNGSDKVNVEGSVSGWAVADAGRVSFFSLRRENKVEEVESNRLSIGFIPKEYALSFILENEQKQALSGATIQLINLDSNQVIEEFASASEAKSLSLVAGNYRFKQTAVDGYIISEDIDFSIDLDGNVINKQNEIYADNLVVMVNKKIVVPTPIETVSVKVEPKKLPETGSTNSLSYLGFSAILIGLLFFKKSK